MSGLSVLSLDLDDTLWPVGPVIAAAENVLLDWMRDRYPHVLEGHTVDSMRAARALIATEHPEYSHDMTYLRRSALSDMFAAAGYPTGPADEALEVFLKARNCVELFADVRPALDRLAGRYRMFAVSNGNANLKMCGIGEYFEGHVTAIAAGAAKPDARIFAELVRLAGVSAGNVLHVGDDPWADVVGAARAGMQTIWLNRTGREWPAQYLPPTRTVVSLVEIV